jgi:hypothetical protein
MLRVDDETLREGLDRAADLFKLHRLSTHDDAELLAAAVFANYGIDEIRHRELMVSLVEMLPVSGDPLAEGLMASSMSAGVLVGLLIANAALRSEAEAVPDCPPVDL